MGPVPCLIRIPFFFVLVRFRYGILIASSSCPCRIRNANEEPRRRGPVLGAARTRPLEVFASVSFCLARVALLGEEPQKMMRVHENTIR